MAGKVIFTNLPKGYAGNVSRMSDNVITPFNYAASLTGNIYFGELVAFDATTNGVRKLASGDSAAAVIGAAVRHISAPKVDSNDGYYYAPGETVDVLVRGSIMVPVEEEEGVTLAPRGTVYVNPATGKVYGATGTGRVALTNAKFGNGAYDEENGVAEVTFFERVI